MSKLRIVYILSLVILAVLIVFTVFKPMTASGKYSEIQREQLLEAKDEWIIQFDIANREGKDTKYTINVSVAGEQYNEEFLIRDGGIYTYIHHIPHNVVGTGEVGVTIYKEGENTPFEQTTYYLK